MQTTIKVNKSVDLKYLSFTVGPRYWEDATVNGVEDTDGDLIPFRDGDDWNVSIDIDKGIIMKWPQGTTAEIHYKVCDDGTYFLKEEDETIRLIKEDYVPNIMPGEHFGDYIILNVDETGKITNWVPVTQEMINQFKPI